MSAAPVDVALSRPRPVPTGLPADVERELAALVGIEPPPVVEDIDRPVDLGDAGADVDEHHFARRLLRVAQLVSVGAFGLLAVSAAIAARYGDHVPRLHEWPFAGWGGVACLAALTLAAVGTDATTLSATRRRAFCLLLLPALLLAVAGVVAVSGGVAGPAWVLFTPVVVVAGAVAGPTLGLAIGAGAAAGVYGAAGVSHTLDVAGVGRLVVILPAFPAIGWAAGALGRLATDAAAEAAWRRTALESDVRQLSAVLDRVAQGDLTVVPASGEHADPVTTGMAVAFADTLLALRRLVRQMDGVAASLAERAQGLAGQAADEASATAAQVAAVAQTTTTIEELAATAASIAETAVRVTQFAGSTRLDVDAGVSAVDLSTVSMDRIAARVADLDRRTAQLRDRIGRISATAAIIDEIARRTAILAVNASVEAARAGETGVGFGNVAEEVANLAARARESTARIRAVVAELFAEAAATADASREGHEAVTAGSTLQDAVVHSLERITQMVDRTIDASREITEATRAQRVASDAVVAAMATVTTSGERYREGSGDHAAAAARLSALAADLRHTLGRFKVS